MREEREIPAQSPGIIPMALPSSSEFLTTPPYAPAPPHMASILPMPLQRVTRNKLCVCWEKGRRKKKENQKPLQKVLPGVHSPEQLQHAKAWSPRLPEAHQEARSKK